jgi:hypothetical protein
MDSDFISFTKQQRKTQKCLNTIIYNVNVVATHKLQQGLPLHETRLSSMAQFYSTQLYNITAALFLCSCDAKAWNR